MRLADLLADRAHDALPADHRAQPQRDRHRDLHPQRDELRGVVDLLLERGHVRLRIRAELRAALLQNAQAFGGQIHVIANVANRGRRHLRERSIGFHLLTDVAHHRGNGRHHVLAKIFGSQELREHRARIGRRSGASARFEQRTLGHVCDGDELGHLARWHGAIQRVSERHGADEDQHDEPHPLLPIVRAVREETPVQREHEQPANPPRRRVRVLRFLIELLALHQRLQRKEQQSRASEADERRQQQRVSHLARLRPVDAARAIATVDQRVRHAHADDRSDQCVRRRRRQTEPPRAEIPQDRRDQQREHHREAGLAADLEDQFHRQQRDDPERHGSARHQHAEKVERARPHDCEVRRQRVRVDDRRNRVRRVVKAVHELEPQRDQQRDAEQEKRQISRRSHAGARDVVAETDRGVSEPTDEQREEQEDRAAAGLAIQLRAGGRGLGERGRCVEGEVALFMRGRPDGKDALIVTRVYDGLFAARVTARSLANEAAMPVR